MLRIGDRVYHKEVRGNGIITDIDETKTKDKYVVEFLWGKYCEIKHGEFNGFKHPERKWQYCREEALIPIPWDYHNDINYVTFLGKRSLDRLMRAVCEIKPRRRRDGSDVVITYGQYKHKVPSNVFVLNRKLISNKYEQCKILGDLAPEVHHFNSMFEPRVDENWLLKPYYSMGGKNIMLYSDADGFTGGETHYFQHKFNKVREFRAHCFLWMDNPVPLIQEKFIDNPDQLCWNKKQGGDFKFVYQELVPKLPDGDFLTELERKELTDISVKALKLLKYDFGGVDIGMDAEGNFKIFEVNSRMGVKEQSLFTYKRVFNALRTLNLDRYKEERWC